MAQVIIIQIVSVVADGNIVDYSSDLKAAGRCTNFPVCPTYLMVREGEGDIKSFQSESPLVVRYFKFSQVYPKGGTQDTQDNNGGAWEDPIDSLCLLDTI